MFAKPTLKIKGYNRFKPLLNLVQINFWQFLFPFLFPYQKTLQFLYSFSHSPEGRSIFSPGWTGVPKSGDSSSFQVKG
jgi:hypothetical protein